MLFIIQFPIVDLRSFVPEETQALNYPVWPTPIPNYDFVRSFGSIKRRPSGGVSGWVAEDVACEANNAIRFEKRLQFHAKKSIVPIKVVFKRFYFDGLVLGKFEVGLRLNMHSVKALSKQESENLICYLLGLPVTIKNQMGDRVSVELHKAGEHLASLYQYSSSRTDSTNLSKQPNWWVTSCNPLLFIADDKGRNIALPYEGDKIELEQINGKITHHYVKYYGQHYRLWYLKLDIPTKLIIKQIGKFVKIFTKYAFSKLSKREQKNSTDFLEKGVDSLFNEFFSSTQYKPRVLRLYLLRLYAEKECLKHVLRSLNTQRLKIVPRENNSQILQRYINDATRRITRLEKHTTNLFPSAKTPILAYAIEDTIMPGEREAILATLKNLDFRKNILNKAEKFVENEDSIQLKTQICKYFSKDEIKELCFLIDVDPDEFSSEKKSIMVLELIQECRKSGCLADFKLLLKDRRPQILTE